MNKDIFCQRWKAFWSNPKNVFVLGLVITITASLIELLRGRAVNYTVYRDATLNFFQGISSYNMEFTDAHWRFYIYSPVFHFLFAPFAYLPLIVGGVAWNVVGYISFYFAVRNLPGELSKHTAPIMLFLLLMVGQAVFFFQYNLIIAVLFLFAFILLEKGHNFWAVLLIMFSATSKIYGIVELALLFCYPKFWRNIGYAVLCGIGFLLLPGVCIGFENLIQWYQDWFDLLSYHSANTCAYLSVVWAEPIRAFALPNMRYIQIGALVILAGLFLAAHRSWTEYRFKVGVIAVLMVYIVLFSEAAEFNTHLISATGFALWYFSQDKHTLFDRILLWSLLVLFGVMPVDLLFPPDWNMYIHTQLWIGVWVFTIAWIRMLYSILYPALSGTSQPLNDKQLQ